MTLLAHAHHFLRLAPNRHNIMRLLPEEVQKLVNKNSCREMGLFERCRRRTPSSR